MNRHSLPEEIDAPQLNSRGRYIYYGHDPSTARQLARLARLIPEMSKLGSLLDEEYILQPAEEIYVLTKDRNNSYISSAVAHLGANGIKSVYWLSESEQLEYENDFNDCIAHENATRAHHYPEAS